MTGVPMEDAMGCDGRRDVKDRMTSRKRRVT